MTYKTFDDRRRIDKKDRDGGLNAEVAIACSGPIRQLPFVRESTVLTDDAQERPPTPPGYRLLVGYAIHALGNSTHERRERQVFALKEGDHMGSYADPDVLPLPCEAVDPATVASGKSGEVTDHVWSEISPTIREPTEGTEPVPSSEGGESS